ncbi:uncharacterized protein LOC115750701 isoform X2 [Rhodamnia argentea]|uniref:Uncharacterized protein LOC115750701 isoform X2 n=1 Tax=Rhodamnia argentea TaxID=178133 RepID=A0ABM3GYZ0_9MYRT|nr:uncharacterized protein LOC115750701 isoform X2 [Rhodamnia argentea]
MSFLAHQDHPQEPPEGEQAPVRERSEEEEEDEHDEACPERLLPQFRVLCCGSPNPTKRRKLPFSSPSPLASNPKKRPSCTLLDREDIDYTLRGFSSITLPSLPSNLQRTSSDPVPLGAYKSVNGFLAAPSSSDHEGVGFDGAVYTSPKKPVFGVNPAMATTPLLGRASSSPSSLPPRPPLQRTVSDPTPHHFPGPINSFSSGSSSSGGRGSAEDSPNSMRLKRMKHCLNEMGKWWDHVMCEAEEDGPYTQDNTLSTEVERKAKQENQETVSVEVAGDCLCINLGCTCGKGFQILISGNKCYYKLV